MRTTKEISDKLKEIKQEISRISDIIGNDETEKDKPALYESGKRSDYPEVTNGFVLFKCIAEKRILQWVLKSNE